MTQRKEMADYEFGEYRFLKPIGKGVQGSVYKAEHKITREIVAVKVVEMVRLTMEKRKSILDEIHILKSLNHPHVVALKDYAVQDKRAYIVMEYCDGGNLSDFIRKRRCLPESLCKHFLQHLALGLRCLRDHNVRHMDLKPSNLLLIKSPKIILKIGDFGLAQRSDDKRRFIRGSPLYMSPQMVADVRYDPKGDLWSVGVITYECLHGKAPYHCQHYDELVEKLRRRAPILISKDLSPVCQDFLSKLLVHFSENRMDYEEFFQHPFLDMVHMPSSETKRLADKKAEEGAELLEVGRVEEAAEAYKEALDYFIPILSDMEEGKEKRALHGRILSYLDKAEKLKKQTLISKFGALQVVADQKYTFDDLLKMCSSTPKLKAQIEICKLGEMYLKEGGYQRGLEEIEKAMPGLLELLEKEPPGLRKKLLFKAVSTEGKVVDMRRKVAKILRDLIRTSANQWMSEAECAKSLLSLKNAEKWEEELNSSYKDMCVIQ